MKLTRRLAALFLAVSLAPAPDSTAHPWLAEPGFQTQASSPRDLYVEAWFKETAESDLESALKLYKQCADLAASSDRELAAKALLRMSRIAATRGDLEAAQLLSDRVKKDFADTAASRDVTKPQVASPSNEGSPEISDARSLLETMLGDGKGITAGKCALVVRTLGIDAVISFARERGYYLAPFLRLLDRNLLSDQEWEHIATQGQADERMAAIERLISSPPSKVSPDLLAHVADAPETIVRALAKLCVAVGTDASLDSLESIVSQRANPVGVDFSLLNALADSPSPRAKQTFDFVFAKFAAQPGFASEVEQMLQRARGEPALPNVLFDDQWVSKAIRAQFSTFPFATRLGFAQHKLLDAEKVFPPDLTPQLLSDPEPGVRIRAIGRLLASTSADVRRDAAQRLQREPKPVVFDAVDEALRTARNAPFEELLSEVTGTLREAAYWNLLNNGDLPRAPALMRYALEHSHPEAIYAAFDPRHSQSLEFSGIGIGNSISRTPVTFQGAFFESLESDSDPDLLLRFVRAMLEVKDETLWINAFLTWSNAVSQIGANPRWIDPRILDLFAFTQSNRLHARIANSNIYSKLSDNALAHLVLEAEPSVRDRLIQTSPPSRLVALVAKAPFEDMSSYLDCAEGPRSSSLALEVLKRVDPASRDALRAVQLTIDREPEALPIALERGSCDDALGHAARIAGMEATNSFVISTEAARYFLAEPNGFGRADSYVHGKLAGIRLDESLREALQPLFPRVGHSDCPNRDWALSAAKVLREQQEAWSRALRELAGRKIVGVLSSTTGTDLGWLSAQLAELEQGDLARSLLASRKLDERILGAKTLARLGAKQDLVAFARSSGQVGEWLKPLIEVGAREELLAMVADRRLTPEEVLREAGPTADPELITALITGNARILVNLGTGWNYLDGALPIAAETLSKRGDVDGLLQLVDLYGSSDAVNALVRLEAFDRIFDRMPNWPEVVCRSLEEVLRPRTGIPEVRFNSDWRTRAGRVEMAEKWRQALAKK